MVNGQNKHCQPTLFHEFTHMWDSENLFLNHDRLDRQRALSLYTEYHASQIEFLRFMEFTSINDKREIHDTDEFWYFDKPLSVRGYYNDKCELLQESIEHYNKDKSIENFKSIIDAYLYIFGTKTYLINLYVLFKCHKQIVFFIVI